jgi:hypothetical protein
MEHSRYQITRFTTYRVVKILWEKSLSDMTSKMLAKYLGSIKLMYKTSFMNKYTNMQVCLCVSE